MSYLDTIAYSEIKKRFEIVIIPYYSVNFDGCLGRKAKHASTEAMKDELFSSILITWQKRFK